MWARRGAAVGIVTKLVDVKTPPGVRIVTGDIPRNHGWIALGSLLEGDGARDVGVTAKDSNYGQRSRAQKLSSVMFLISFSQPFENAPVEGWCSFAGPLRWSYPQVRIFGPSTTQAKAHCSVEPSEHHEVQLAFETPHWNKNPWSWQIAGLSGTSGMG